MSAPPVAERCRLKALELVCLCLLVLAALVVRVADTSWHPFGPDEGWTFDLAISPWQELVAKTAADTHPPLHYAMVKLLFKAFGEDIYWGKLLSVAFATATLPLVFFLARIWFTPRAAWLAVVFAAFTPFQIYWSHVARNHLLLPFFTTGIVVLTELIRERPTRMWGVLMILAWIGAIQMNYMSFVFGFVWGVAYILLDRMPWRRKALLAAYTLPALASYIPWFAILRAHTEHSPMTIAFFQEVITPISRSYHSI
ncbi:glycosyltransferase family 39 protein, partial [Candidatus Sumerlaeota bacterium]|nr:glycosyltransferase family 39 protein [Candidatus Sumerlaeota bacterium]